MANKVLEHKNYAQVELNNCAFRRDGRIVADCIATMVIQNGMLALVDRVKKTAKPATSVPTANEQAVLVYNAEHSPASTFNRLCDYVSQAGDGIRGGLLSVGDVFTTNAVMYDDTKYANISKISDALKAGTPVYAIGGDEAGAGFWLITNAVTGTPTVTGIVKEVTTTPDGYPALKIVITKA